MGFAWRVRAVRDRGTWRAVGRGRPERRSLLNRERGGGKRGNSTGKRGSGAGWLQPPSCRHRPLCPSVTAVPEPLLPVPALGHRGRSLRPGSYRRRSHVPEGHRTAQWWSGRAGESSHGRRLHQGICFCGNNASAATAASHRHGLFTTSLLSLDVLYLG